MGASPTNFHPDELLFRNHHATSTCTGFPPLLRLVRLEPRVAAGPLALAGADVITILIYLNLARWLLP